MLIHVPSIDVCALDVFTFGHFHLILVTKNWLLVNQSEDESGSRELMRIFLSLPVNRNLLMRTLKSVTEDGSGASSLPLHHRLEDYCHIFTISIVRPVSYVANRICI